MFSNCTTSNISQSDPFIFARWQVMKPFSIFESSAPFQVVTAV